MNIPLKKWRKLFLFLFLLSFSFAALGKNTEKKITFDFTRNVRKGDSFNCFVKLERSCDYILAIPGVDKKLEKYESVQVDFVGLITVEEANQAGNMRSVSIRIASLSGSYNGTPVTGKTLTGKIFRADLSRSPAHFSCINDKRFVLKKEELALLRAVFPPETENKLSDLTGKTRSLSPGEIFPLHTEKFRKALAERKIFCSEKEMESSCRFDGIFPFRGKQCGRFHIHIKSDKVTGYQFRFQATCHIPEDPEQGPPVSIQREALEFLTRRISPVNRFASGGQMTMEAKESASFVLLPAENQASSRKDGAFFDLLKRK